MPAASGAAAERRAAPVSCGRWGRRSGLHDAQGRELFTGAFTYLGQRGLSGETAFRDLLGTLFNASAPGALHVRRYNDFYRRVYQEQIRDHYRFRPPPYGLRD